MGKVWLQTAVDGHSRYAWGRLYPNKLPVTAVHLMNNDVLPTFEAYQARIAIVLSDNGRECCGRPQSNGFVERLHRTLLDEHYRIMERKKFHDSIEAMQNDRDAYLITYNTQNASGGKNEKCRLH